MPFYRVARTREKLAIITEVAEYEIVQARTEKEAIACAKADEDGYDYTDTVDVRDVPDKIVASGVATGRLTRALKKLEEWEVEVVPYEDLDAQEKAAIRRQHEENYMVDGGHRLDAIRHLDGEAYAL